MIKKTLLATVFSLSLATIATAEETVIATVNGEKIFQSELNRNLEQIPNFDALPAEQQKLIKNKILQAITKLRAVVQEAKKLKIEESESYRSKLKDFEQQLMYSTLLENHLNNIVTEPKLKEYYNKNKKQFIESKAKASHILVSTKKEAQEVIQKLIAGSDFKELAKEFSIGPSSQDGGNLGWFTRDTMVSEFSDAVFKLKNGQFTKTPVQTQFGWHVIQLDEKVEDTPSLFEDVKDQIKEVIMQEEVENYLDNILNKAEIIINDEK